MVGMRLWLSAAVALIVVAIDGRVEGSAVYNSTNGHETNHVTFRALLDDGNRQDATAICVENIQRMKLKFARPEQYSFPPADFVPEGAWEWCECIIANPPLIGNLRPLREYEDNPYLYGDLEKYRSLVPQGLRDAYDASFNSCRAQVLKGSNINTVDICRGMFSLFGRQMNTLLVSFCGQMCKDPPRNFYFPYYTSPELQFLHDCTEECGRAAMPGYCSTTLLEYSAFESFAAAGPDGRSINRKVNVNGRTELRQELIRSNGPAREQVDEVCSAMVPTLGNKNECCNYPKGFSLLSQCCVLNEDGLAVFDCNTLTRDELLATCVKSFGETYFLSYYEKLCENVIQPYLANPEYEGTAKRYGNAVLFPEQVLRELCRSDGYDDGTLCCGYTSFPFVANCVPTDQLEPYSGGISGVRPTEPTRAAADAADPCHGACSDGSDCVVTGNGSAFCVECSALLITAQDGSDLQCCTYDAENLRCATARKGLVPGSCRRNQDIFVVNEEDERSKATFRSRTGYACASPRDFRRNGKACRVRVNAAGKVRCT